MFISGDSLLSCLHLVSAIHVYVFEEKLESKDQDRFDSTQSSNVRSHCVIVCYVFSKKELN